MEASIKMEVSDKLAFKPYTYMWVDEHGERYEWDLISLTLNGYVIKLTNYNIYIGDKKRTRRITKQNKDDVRRVCNFLNYVLFDKFWTYKAKNISTIPFEAVKAYLMEYAKTKTKFGDYPSAQSVEKERCAVCHFMANLEPYRKDRKEHYYVRLLKNNKAKSDNGLRIHRNNELVCWEYEIQAEYLGNYSYNLIRDIPQKAIPVILKWIQLVAPDIYLAVILQLCSGIREGDVMNIRRANSKYYGGIRYTKVNGRFTSFEIDLNKEYLLRSDGIDVGGIKVKRVQEVYKPLLPFVQKAYERHLKMIGDNEIEDGAPLFVTSTIKKATGKRMALTKHAYCNRVQSIVRKYVIPELIVSEDIELKAFAMKMNSGNWGLHAFRHWFTVQLVLDGLDANQIAFWRGDKSTKTAFVYLQNKGILMQKYKKISNEVTDDLITVLSEMTDEYGK